MSRISSTIRHLIGIDIIRVFSLNAISTLIRMLAGLISVKVIAVIIGPAGIAILGQLRNFESILLGLANGGINSGITKYVSEHKDDDAQIRIYISNALWITLIASAIVSVCLIFGCKQISQLVLLTDEYYYVFIIFGFTIVLYTINTLLISILNGYKQFKKYVLVNISGTIFGLVYAIALVYLWGLKGALINAVTYQSVILLITIWMCRKLPWMHLDYFKQRLNKVIVKKYLGYSLMSLVTLAISPLIRLLLRGHVISEISAEDAGIWEGMNSISNMYLSVITTAFSIYYLPRLSEIKDTYELHAEIFRCYKIIVPMLLAISISIYLLRFFIIWLLFTPEFNSMEELFAWQLCGDFFKICSWMLAFIMVAKALTKRYIATEIIFGLSYLVLSFVFLQMNGIVGLVQGYLVNYILYMAIMAFLFRNIIKAKKI